MRTYSKDYWVRVSGELACWTPPEYRAERISNLMPSHDAWEGLLRTILGKREIRWAISEARMLFEPKYLPMLLSELKFNGRKNFVEPIRVSEQRTQRTTVFLKNPDYLLHAKMHLTKHAEPDEPVIKYEEMFERRMKNGQQYGQPCFGLRELLADVEMVEASEAAGLLPTDVNSHLGFTYYGTDWEDPEQSQYFVPLDVCKGVARYPSWDEVKKTGLRRSARSAG